MEYEAERIVCDGCGKGMNQGFHFEGDGTSYCNKKCLFKVITWDEYLALHDNGNGDAYYTDWEEHDEEGYYKKACV